MAVPAGPTEIRYVGNGVTTVFAVPFLVIQATDLAVYVDGVRLTSGYVQSGVGNPTSTVTFSAAPAVLAQILFALEVPFERLNDYQENGDFLSSTVNRDFDRIWQALKQLLRFSTRALTLGYFDVDGQGWYRAKGNGIRGLHDPVELQDAATKNWVQKFIESILATGQGPISNAANVVYVGPRVEHIGSVQDMSNMIDPLQGAGLIGYSGRKLSEHLGDWESIKDYGVKGDGVAVETLAINEAIAAVTAKKKKIFFPAGTYVTEGIDTIANMCLVGEHYINTRIKLADGANSPLLKWNNSQPGMDYMSISGFLWDGNWKDSAGVVKNSQGGTLYLVGIRTTFEDNIVTNTADVGVITDWKLAGLPAGYGDNTGGQGFFRRNTVTKTGKTGWIHNGPTDSRFESLGGRKN